MCAIPDQAMAPQGPDTVCRTEENNGRHGQRKGPSSGIQTCMSRTSTTRFISLKDKTLSVEYHEDGGWVRVRLESPEIAHNWLHINAEEWTAEDLTGIGMAIYSACAALCEEDIEITIEDD